MQRRSVGSNPNPVGINFMAFCVGKMHSSDHQNRYFSETILCDSLRSHFLLLGFVYCLI